MILTGRCDQTFPLICFKVPGPVIIIFIIIIIIIIIIELCLQVSIAAGESRAFTNPKNKTNKGPVTEVVGDDWGYDFSWTLRDGEQMLEQHQYVEPLFCLIFDHLPRISRPYAAPHAPL